MSIQEYALQATESHVFLIDLVKMTTDDMRDILSLNKPFAMRAITILRHAN